MSDEAKEPAVSRQAQRLPAQRGRQISLKLDGRDVSGYEGETLSGLLLAEQVWNLQQDRGRKTGLFCNIGQCHGCLVQVEGMGTVRACQTPAQEGMIITTCQEDKA